MLDADGQADKVVRHRARRALHGLAVFGQAFHTAERGGRHDDLEARADAPRIGHPALDQEREHSAEAVGHLTHRYGVAAMRREAGIEHALDLRMSFEMTRDAERIGGSLAVTHEKRTQAANEKPAFEWRERRSDLGTQARNLLPACIDAPGDQNARQYVGMAVEIFGGRMKDDV